MAKAKQDSDVTVDKIIKECPNCRATLFQGPYHRGEIVNGEFVAKETLYNCANCHRPLALSEMNDRPVEIVHQ